MSAKGVLVNPILVGQDFIAMFDRQQTPECTEKKEGYWWFNHATANQSSTTLTMSIRDFDKDNFEARKTFVHEAVNRLQAMYPRANIQVDIVDVYANIANNLSEDKRSIDLLFAAIDDIGVTPKVIPMRGGTDGAALSAKGLITPNYFTGAHNFHSRYEFLPIPSFEKSLELTLKIIEKAKGE